MPKNATRNTGRPVPTEDEASFLASIGSYPQAMQEIRGMAHQLRGPWIVGRRGRWPVPEDDADYGSFARMGWFLADKFGVAGGLAAPDSAPMSPHQASDYIAKVTSAFENRTRKEYWKERHRIARVLRKTFLDMLVADSAWEIRRFGLGTDQEQAVRFLKLLISEITAYEAAWGKPYGITSYVHAAIRAHSEVAEFLPNVALPDVPGGAVTFPELQRYLSRLLRIATTKAAYEKRTRVAARLKERPLSKGKRECLQALLELGALDPGHSATSNEIAAKARGKPDGGLVKRDLGLLVHANYCGSSGGSDGGYWLRPSGRRIAEKLRGS